MHEATLDFTQPGPASEKPVSHHPGQLHKGFTLLTESITLD